MAPVREDSRYLLVSDVQKRIAPELGMMNEGDAQADLDLMRGSRTPSNFDASSAAASQIFEGWSRPILHVRRHPYGFRTCKNSSSEILQLMHPQASSNAREEVYNLPTYVGRRSTTLLPSSMDTAFPKRNRSTYARNKERVALLSALEEEGTPEPCCVIELPSLPFPLSCPSFLKAYVTPIFRTSIPIDLSGHKWYLAPDSLAQQVLDFIEQADKEWEGINESVVKKETSSGEQSKEFVVARKVLNEIRRRIARDDGQATGAMSPEDFKATMRQFQDQLDPMERYQRALRIRRAEKWMQEKLEKNPMLATLPVMKFAVEGEM